jgi:hypothetical protein
MGMTDDTQEFFRSCSHILVAQRYRHVTEVLRSNFGTSDRHLLEVTESAVLVLIDLLLVGFWQHGMVEFSSSWNLRI